jgi:peptide chain release factor 1
MALITSQWDLLEQKHVCLSTRAADPALSSADRRVVQKELALLDALLAKHREIQKIAQEILVVQEQLHLADGEMRGLYIDELTALHEHQTRLNQEIEALMAPCDEHDERDVYLEIRAGTGGQEAALFAGDLMRMYMAYAQQYGWKVTVESASVTDLGGYREIILHIQGKGAYGKLKFESGVHRVQRVPVTETSGRVHTSTVTVAVMPEAGEVDVIINPADLRIDVYRSSGAGGQHVNTTDSAVRITHIPTGVVVACQDERSQHKNKAKAMKLLQSRILAAQVEKQRHEMSALRKEQVGTGERAEKVRTYNFPQNRITDHQVDITLKNLDVVMTGALNPIIDALRVQEMEQRKEAFLKSLIL